MEEPINILTKNPYLVFFFPLFMAIIAASPIAEFNRFIFLLFFVIAVIFSTILYVIFKDFKIHIDDYLNYRNHGKFIIHSFLKHEHIVNSQSVIINLNESFGAEIIRAYNLTYLGSSTFTTFYIPWFYDVYDKSLEQDYIPEVTKLSVKYYDELKNPKYDKIYKPNEFDGDQIIKPHYILNYRDSPISEAKVWAVVPINLKHNWSADINIEFRQKHLFQKMLTKKGEWAGCITTSPTRCATLEVNAPENHRIKKIEELGITKKITNRSVGIWDFNELALIEDPIFDSTCFKWRINEPKVGYCYSVQFQVLPPSIRK